MATTSPYNFVPANREVVFPENAERVTHDIPFRKGICGTLEIEIRPKTPIFIRDGEHETRFFQLPGQDQLPEQDRLRGIPGSSLKGMLRNVVQIASFGKLAPINDHTFGIRDLHDRHVYGQHMSVIGNDGFVPLVEAGWLHRGPDGEYQDGEPRWLIEPCAFAKVSYQKLTAFAASKGVDGYEPGKRKAAAHEKYARWPDRQRSGVHAVVRTLQRAGEKLKDAPPRRQDYGVVESLRDGPSASAVPGSLVFTGQPKPYTNPKDKHHDFFFYDETSGKVEVQEEKRRAFTFVHSNSGEQHRIDLRPNEEWGYWREKLCAEERVPVFYLLDKDGNLRAMGLAMMFRLAFDLSTEQVVLNAQPDALSPKPDLADLIFGRASDRGRDENDLGGRISIETAIESSDDRCKAEEMVEGVLGGPKASFYPHYIEQSDKGYGENPPRPGRVVEWVSYMDAGDGEITPRARGFKRYPRREQVIPLPRIPNESRKPKKPELEVKFCPIRQGSFRARIHVHNLRDFELGALLWALDFGGSPECWHAIGLARPAGYGSIVITVKEHSLDVNDGSPIELANVVEAYTSYMEEQVQRFESSRPISWEKSPQITELRQQATPVSGPPGRSLAFMDLKQFRDVKPAGVALAPRVTTDERRKSADELKRLRVQYRKERTKRETVAKDLREATELQQKVAEADPLEAATLLLEHAKESSTHLELIRQWMREPSDDDISRRKAARKIVPKSKNWKKGNAEIWAWINP